MLGGAVKSTDWPWSSHWFLRHAAKSSDRFPELASQLPIGFTNTLYFGDNLEVLRRHVADESVDLIYLDPPFKSVPAYNMLFRHRDGRAASGQVKAFSDSWHWSMESARVYQDLVEQGGDLSRALRALREILSTNDLLAYLTMMAPRIVELRRVLKPTGSLYMHCDPTASHYLKVLLDAAFGGEFFRNEIIWKRTNAHSSAKKFAPIHDVILCYGKGAHPTWTQPRLPYEESYLNRYYKFDDGDGRLYWRADLCAAGVRKGSSGQAWRGFEPALKGMHWKFKVERLDELDAAGRIYWPKGGTGWPQYKRYREELKGKAVSDIWEDIDKINPVGNERLGYPTQKPVALLERIIESSTNPDDLVLDPFCGCGTAIDAAQKLGRRWVGIDITRVAIEVIVDRLHSIYGQLDYVLVGEPSSIDEAHALAELDKHEFEAWVCRRVGASGLHRKGADRGVDGEFVGVFDNGDSWRGIVSVKGGSVGVSQVRDLWGVIQREKAEFGVFVSLKKPTPAMTREGADAGFTSEGIPRLQLVTVDQIFDEGSLAILLPEGQKAEEKKRKLRAV